MAILGRVTRVDADNVSVCLEIPWIMLGDSSPLLNELARLGVEWVGPPPKPHPHILRRWLNVFYRVG